jgi:threonine dehydrogenase-like Zn-dependent dehydrogenase
VIGIGGVGHIALQLMGELGSSRLIAVDSDERRRALAGEFGADDVLSSGEAARAGVADLTSGRGVEVVLDFVGTDQAHADGDRAARARWDLLADRLSRHDHGAVGGAQRGA